MQVGSWWVITGNTLKGPWHVTSKGKNWYIINILTETTVKIGPFRMSGMNYCDRAKMIARDRNEKFLADTRELPKYLGRHPEFDKTIAEVLQEA